jgi:hypothetical protein
MAMTVAGKNRIMIFGPKQDGTYVVEFRTAAGEALAISIPRSKAGVIRHFQEQMPYGLFVPDVTRRPNRKGRPSLRRGCFTTVPVNRSGSKSTDFPRAVASCSRLVPS